MLKIKQLGFLLLALFLVVVVFIAFQSKAIKIDGVRALYAPMKVTIEEEGKTRVIDHFVITAPIDAYMQRIVLNEGDNIKKGQTLLILEPLPSSVLDPRSRAQAEATLAATKELEKVIKEMSKASAADKQLADITLQRTTKLRKNKVVAQHELDIAKAEKRRADAVYRASQFSWVFTQYLTQMSRSALDYEDVRQMDHKSHRFTLTSLANGKVLKLTDKSERVVKTGETLIEIGDIKQIEVEADVLSTVAVKLTQGMPVEILRWGGEQILHGVIKRIEPSGFTKISALGVEEQRVKVILDITSDYTIRKQIGHGYRVESRFILWQSDKVLQIPNSALFRDNGVVADNGKKEWAVYVIKGNKLHKRSVEIGHRNNLMAEVIEGLAENEQLVSYLSNELKEGLRIEIR